MSRQILNGWKEISSYIERSVRTVQRWEVSLGLPVYRPALKDRTAVVAFSDELDRWISRGSPAVLEEGTAPRGKNENNDSLLRLLEDMNTVVGDTSELASQIRLLQKELSQALDSYHNTVTSRRQANAAPQPGQVGSVLSFPPRRHRLALQSKAFAGAPFPATPGLNAR
jgi:hypothetical protein